MPEFRHPVMTEMNESGTNKVFRGHFVLQILSTFAKRGNRASLGWSISGKCLSWELRCCQSGQIWIFWSRHPRRERLSGVRPRDSPRHEPPDPRRQGYTGHHHSHAMRCVKKPNFPRRTSITSQFLKILTTFGVNAHKIAPRTRDRVRRAWRGYM